MFCLRCCRNSVAVRRILCQFPRLAKYQSVESYKLSSLTYPLTFPRSYYNLSKVLSNEASAISSSKRFKKYGTLSKEKKKKDRTSSTPEIEKLNVQVKGFKEEKLALPSYNPNKYTQRTHTCGELTGNDVGQTVRLCGWLTFKRLNGLFLVLRDLYGVTQVYVPKEKEDEVRKANDAPLETVLEIVGKVVLRPENQRKDVFLIPAGNSFVLYCQLLDQISGDIEIVAEEVNVLNPAEHLRLGFNDLSKVDEELGMRHRYLYLRNAKLQSILRMRSLFIGNIRRFMEANNFIDIETPTLIRRTPGGAREFPVLTKFKDSYYALAQSPQLLKQLLMVAGMDRYYQIARCYRDEGGKPDRQPEFTQLDIELSFTSREEVMTLIEDLMKYACPKEIIPDIEKPFQVMTYKECMDQYGSDKPDTGGFLWVIDFPLFLRNPTTHELESAHHPFTMPKSLDDLNKNLEEALGLSYDLVYCGAEVGGGSIRIHDAKLQRFVFETILKLNIEDIDYLLEALESGCPPHGGFALGIDRFLSKMMKTNSIRDVIAFPKTGEGKDLLSGAPNDLDKNAKEYYGIK